MTKEDRALIMFTAIMVAVAVSILSYLMWTLPTTEQMNNIISEHNSTTTTIIYEDDPQWDCQTMGNHICGPTN
jgi:hypothetical protein